MPDATLPAGAFDEIHGVLAAEGPAAAADRLVETLRTAGNYDALFYALLLRARLRLGADPIPTRPAGELPEACTPRMKTRFAKRLAPLANCLSTPPKFPAPGIITG